VQGAQLHGRAASPPADDQWNARSGQAQLHMYILSARMSGHRRGHLGQCPPDSTRCQNQALKQWHNLCVFFWLFCCYCWPVFFVKTSFENDLVVLQIKSGCRDPVSCDLCAW